MFLFLPPANEVWDKVIFSEACVKNSVHRGRVLPPGGTSSRGCFLKGGASSWGLLPPGGAFSRGVPAGDPPGWLLLRPVRILLECILVIRDVLFTINRKSLF